MASASPGWKYHAFINFRGFDTRDSFTGHLHEALTKGGIRPYKDDVDLDKGAEITPKLMQGISDSMCAIVIFSQNYAGSSFCLDELVHILECKRTRNQTVIPIFYRVDPSDVQELKGEFKTKLLQLEDEVKTKYLNLEAWGNAMSNPDNISNDPDPNTPQSWRTAIEKHYVKMQSWRNALKEVSKLAGWDSYVVRDEAVLVRKIVREISFKVNRAYPITNEGLVGIEDGREEAVKDKLLLDLNDATITVGICGVGGLGKTTIAKVVYDSIRLSSEHYTEAPAPADGSTVTETEPRFDCWCFLADVREKFENYGPCVLQEQLVSETAETVKIWTADGGTSVIKHRLQNKKVFLVFDDISDLKQLKVLAGDPSWFGKGSRIIITCRDEHLLRVYGVEQKNIYKPDPLNANEALALFCLKAFNQAKTKENYEKLSKEAVDYTKGLPLALEVLGSFLHGRDLVEWRSALGRLKDIPDVEIMDVLQLSYDVLNELEKQIFLDIACFFKGMDKDRVANILDDFGFHSKIGIQVLIDKFLITESSNELQMHDLLQKMAQEIVRRESCREPERRSRLWKYEDVCDVMINNKQSDAVEGILLQLPRTGQRWNTNAFSKMIRLRLLIIHNGHLARGETTLPNALQFLEWHGYPSPWLPPCFEPYKLVELDMSHSNIEKLWYHDNMQTMPTLKFINLSHSQRLKKTPDFTVTPNLERLNFEGCKRLHIVHPSIGHLLKLEYLNMAGCSKLKSFPPFIRRMESMLEFYLDKTSIEVLSHSIELLSALKILSLRDCKNLQGIPTSIGNLTSLEKLDLAGSSVVLSAQEESVRHVDPPGTSTRYPPFWLEQRKEVEALFLSMPSPLGICPLRLMVRSNEGERVVTMNLACFPSLTILPTLYPHISVPPYYLSRVKPLRLTAYPNELDG